MPGSISLVLNSISNFPAILSITLITLTPREFLFRTMANLTQLPFRDNVSEQFSLGAGALLSLDALYKDPMSFYCIGESFGGLILDEQEQSFSSNHSLLLTLGKLWEQFIPVSWCAGGKKLFTVPARDPEP